LEHGLDLVAWRQSLDLAASAKAVWKFGAYERNHRLGQFDLHALQYLCLNANHHALDLLDQFDPHPMDGASMEAMRLDDSQDHLQLDLHLHQSQYLDHQYDPSEDDWYRIDRPFEGEARRYCPQLRLE
jgi:hypothetical protein